MACAVEYFVRPSVRPIVGLFDMPGIALPALSAARRIYLRIHMRQKCGDIFFRRMSFVILSHTNASFNHHHGTASQSLMLTMIITPTVCG